MIVGLVGKKSSGKDTTGAILVEEHGFTRVSFADALKQSAAALFDVPVETWDRLKNDPLAKVALIVGWGTPYSETKDMTVREFLQRYGTEAHRDVWGGDFWIETAAAKMRAVLEADGSVVVTDCRFPEEAQAVRNLGGMVVRVVRPLGEDGDMHPSEVVQESIEADFELWNGGTIADLRSAVAFDVMRRGMPATFPRGEKIDKFTDETSRRFTT